MNDWKFNYLQYELYKLREMEERKYYKEDYEKVKNERLDNWCKVIWFVIIPICLVGLFLAMKYANVI